VESLLIAFGLVFVAELGDKTQLVALSLAARYRPLPVLAGLALAHACTQGLSIAVGGAIGTAVPRAVVSAGAGLLFLAFAFWTLRNGDDDDPAIELRGRAVVPAVAAAIFVAALGDKTMLTAATLAARGAPLLVWAGGTAGVVAAGAVAVAVGNLLGARLPAATIRRVAAALFALFGLLLLADAAGLVRA
jgi:putative Ca2+/H+ antiporter (TMEM165/GDT1 family)